MKTIKEVEAQVEEKVGGPLPLKEGLKELNLLPEGYQCVVRLHGKSRDKRRTASFENNWSPDTDSIQIRFRRISEQAQESPQPVAQGAAVPSANDAAQPGPVATDPLSDLVRELDRVESRPGYAFVALKWFRDKVLQERFLWARDHSARQTVLRDAIDKRLILTSKVPNKPNSPQFPVTAIRLNRLVPEVGRILGSPEGAASDFDPVPIRGETLSATVLRDRR